MCGAQLDRLHKHTHINNTAVMLFGKIPQGAVVSIGFQGRDKREAYRVRTPYEK